MFRFNKYVNIVHHVGKTLCNIAVTPFVGVRIEILPITSSTNSIYVTPFVGVRIEIAITGGKKCKGNVTPFVGVRIEIKRSRYHVWQHGSHSLRGSAD